MAVVHSNAGQLPAPETLVSLPRLMAAYYTEFPDTENSEQLVSFGTSGHRGNSFLHTFNEEHVYAITQAVCDYRRKQGITGPLYMGGDTHALSEAAFRSALEVLVANEVEVRVASHNAYTTTPAISHAILSWNAGRTEGLADGIVITPSHNPPQDGGFKYNPPHGGPADTDVTAWIEERANTYLKDDNRKVKITNLTAARKSKFVAEHDFVAQYCADLPKAVDMESIKSSGLHLGVDPLGGASLAFFEDIADRFGLDLTIVNHEVDPTFRFVPCDKDGKIRMDCSSPYAMSGLLKMKDSFDLAFACDPDSDRHGIVTKSGLMNPNHYLSAVAWYLFRTRTQWPASCGIGKTLVTTGLIDRVAALLKRPVIEVPVGFKWFVPYLHDGRCGMGCEESAGASFLCFDGSVWSTDKDGPLLCMLACEMMAKEDRSPSEIYTQLTRELGEPHYQRLDAPCDTATKKLLKSLSKDSVTMKTLAGAPIVSVETHASGNNAAIGGVKVTSPDGWFAVRPSGTEAICKLYTESFKGQKELEALQKDALKFMDDLLHKGA
ncbi:MAG: phosphoglucomutase (alpha-D-glucose-1,6-bisphosphate-dependent) [Desulfovibrio sp.]|nr:phosphoglucomutase (alpha-D-glucose-1,6-bisphosphate-dependent) [Desulfovibrio sp.]